ncbi:hypothetical protein LO762_04240 [Actinocorallia sp. API 0066]|uniref:DUF6879 family protein n=1 Tax=Actinocorallia sp. API 0066 TaxID=2896846 RepID=UPI001E4C594C|nr:DUF6879 family protein [Actinocorallia sp. API 0066]MCD0448409.1 hypothetical protein [Actinocorallia sp. API 0066]
MFLADDEWQEYFGTFKRYAWRLELHPVYTMPHEEEALAQFREGYRLPEDYVSGWAKKVSSYVASGRSIGRVHIVRQPLSEYLQFEFDYYRGHARAGEDIRILDLTGKDDPGLPDHDFYLFDDEAVVRMLYRPDGTQIGRELVENPDIESYLRYRDIALDGAIPFREYWQG